LRGTEYTHVRETTKEGDNLYTTGNQVILVTATQGRNNARIIISGSLDLFSNELFAKSKGVNRKYANHLINWTFGLTGIIKYQNIHHHLVGTSNQPGEYKTSDRVEYSMEILTWNDEKKSWVPYVADDVILEFIMLDPYYRIPIEFNTQR